MKYVLVLFMTLHFFIACSSEPLDRKTFSSLISIEEVSEILELELVDREVAIDSVSTNVRHHVFTYVYGMENKYSALYSETNGNSPFAMYVFQFATDRHARETLDDFVLSENLILTPAKVGHRSFMGTLSGSGISGAIQNPDLVAFLTGRLIVVMEFDPRYGEERRTNQLEIAEALEEKL
tara:strand:- start:6301 stop:6840 length:540 start_codon:yes stop_codon:yes gene_type:complete